MASNELEVLDPAATVEKPKKTVPGVELNRRHFMTALGVAGVAAGTGLVSGPVARAQQQTPNGYNQVDVLNFLLNIKYLKATMYAFITTGSDIPATYATPEPTLGTGQIYNQPAQVAFTGNNAAQLTDMFNEMFYDELNQVVDLQALLGAATLPRTTINVLGTSAASTSATAVSFSAPPATSAISGTLALSYAQLLEDLSATAFAGALSYLTGANLATAAQILAVDGCHAGAVRLACIQAGAPYIGSQFNSFTAGTGQGTTSIWISGNFPSFVVVGAPVSGAGIPAGATITSIVNAASISVAGRVHTSNNTFTGVASNTGLAPGQSITGGNINANTVITSVTGSAGNYTINMSQNSGTGGATGESATVGQSYIAISQPATATGLTSVFIPVANPADVAPADVGAGIATTGSIPTPGTSPVLYEGFFDAAGSSNANGTTPAGLTFARTFSQVLAVLYNSTVTTTYSGGYFPIGVAGSITVV